MRLFTALPLPEQTKEQLTEIARGRLPIPYISTINLHITLNFFGELADDQVKKVESYFSEIVKGHTSFFIEFESIVKFHHQLHMTVRKNDQLNELQSDLARGFNRLGFLFEDRAYYPHVKLGNLHMDNIMNRQRKMENFPNEELSKLKFSANNVMLYESKLLLHHPKYIPLQEEPFI